MVFLGPRWRPLVVSSLIDELMRGIKARVAVVLLRRIESQGAILSTTSIHLSPQVSADDRRLVGMVKVELQEIARMRQRKQLPENFGEPEDDAEQPQ